MPDFDVFLFGKAAELEAGGEEKNITVNPPLLYLKSDIGRFQCVPGT